MRLNSVVKMNFPVFTDSGIHYSVGFMEDDILLSKDSYQLIIANINNHKSPRDYKVRDTILSIVDEFSIPIIPLCFIFVKPGITNNVCEAVCLSIGFLRIPVNPSSQQYLLPS